MKKIILFLSIAVLLASCDADTSSNVSTVTNYATLTVNGDAFVLLTQGDAYTDAGAVAIAGDETLDVTTSGAADPNTPGVYKITYQAFNADGFSSSAVRTVVVLSSAPSTINLAGTFFRNGNPNNVTQLADRIYVCDNATGYFVTNPEIEDNLTLTFYNIDDEHVYAPFQENTSISGISAESNVGNIYNQDHWDWVIFASGVFGTATRDFTR